MRSTRNKIFILPTNRIFGHYPEEAANVAKKPSCIFHGYGLHSNQRTAGFRNHSYTIQSKAPKVPASIRNITKKRINNKDKAEDKHDEEAKEGEAKEEAAKGEDEEARECEPLRLKVVCKALLHRVQHLVSLNEAVEEFRGGAERDHVGTRVGV